MSKELFQAIALQFHSIGFQVNIKFCLQRIENCQIRGHSARTINNCRVHNCRTDLKKSIQNYLPRSKDLEFPPSLLQSLLSRVFPILRLLEFFSKIVTYLAKSHTVSHEGGGVSRKISGLVITTSVTSRHTSVISDMAAKFFGSLTERYVDISNILVIRLLCSMLPRIQNI